MKLCWQNVYILWPFVSWCRKKWFNLGVGPHPWDEIQCKCSEAADGNQNIYPWNKVTDFNSPSEKAKSWHKHFQWKSLTNRNKAAWRQAPVIRWKARSGHAFHLYSQWWAPQKPWWGCLWAIMQRISEFPGAKTYLNALWSPNTSQRVRCIMDLLVTIHLPLLSVLHPAPPSSVALRDLPSCS